MKPTPHTPQIQEFIQKLNELTTINPFYKRFVEREFSYEWLTIKHHRLSLNDNTLLYQIFLQEIKEDDPALEQYFEDYDAFYEKTKNYPYELQKEWTFSSVQELVYHLINDFSLAISTLDYKVSKPSLEQVQKEYEKDYPNTDWCTVSIFEFKAYPVPRHEFATKPEHDKEETIYLNSIHHYFKKDVLQRLVAWKNKYRQKQNDTLKKIWCEIDNEINQKQLNQLLGLPQKTIDINTKPLLNADEEFEKVRQYIKAHPKIFCFYIELIALLVLFGVLMTMGILHFFNIKLGFLAYAIITWLFILFGGVKIMTWLAQVHDYHKFLGLRSRFGTSSIPQPSKPQIFWQSGKKSQKWALAVLMAFSLYVAFVVLQLPKLLAQSALYATIALGAVWGFSLQKED